MLSQWWKGFMELGSLHSDDGQGVGQGAETRSMLPRGEEAVVPEPCRNQAVADRPPLRTVRIGRCRRGPRCRARRLVPDRPRAHRGEGTRYFFEAEGGIRDLTVTGVQTCALPI